MNEDKDIKTFTGSNEAEARAKAEAYARQNNRIVENVQPVLNESSQGGATVRATMRRQMLLG